MHPQRTPRTINRAASPLAIGVVAVVALVFRLLPLLLSGSLDSFRGYDDGVHFNAGVHLIAGSLPYRDFVLVHPPGIALLMAPFAWLAQLSSDHLGIAAARLLFVGVGSLNATLVALLLRRRGTLAALAGGGLYAVWTAATIAERSIMLSPLLNTCVLAALLLLRLRVPRMASRACACAGAILGLALCFKLWAVVPIAVLGLLVAVRFGWRRLRPFIAGGAASTVLICGPFFLAAPAAMFNDVILAQIQRGDGAAKDIAVRLRYFVGTPVPAAVMVGLLLFMAVAFLVPVAKELVNRRRPGRWDDSVWWAALAVAISVTLLVSNSFFDHYVNFAAPAIALSVGSLVGSLTRVASLGGRTATAALALVGLSLLVAVGAKGILLQPDALPPATTKTMSAAAAAYTCVWAPYSYLAVVSDSLTRSMQHECAPVVDISGQWMVLNDHLPVPDTAVTDRASSDSAEGLKLSESQAAIVGLPMERYGLSAQMQQVLHGRFRLTATSGNLQFWVKR